MLSPDILTECFPIWPQYRTYSRISGIFQDIRHIPENLSSSRKSVIFQKIWHIPGNQGSSSKSAIFQKIRNIPGNQASSRISRTFQEIRERGHELSSNVFWVPRTKWTIFHNLDIYASVFRVFCNIKNMKIQVLLLFYSKWPCMLIILPYIG